MTKRMTPIAATLLFGLGFVYSAKGQVSVAPTPVPKFRDFIASGAPNAGGCVYTTTTGTSTPLATYSDSTGGTPNANPVQLDANGEAQIWLQAFTYRFSVWTKGTGGTVGADCFSGTLRYTIDGISEKGLLSTASLSVLLAPPGAVNQTVVGPLTATQFNGPSTGWTTPLTINTATNKPTVTTTNPAAPGQNYQVPDPATASSHFVMDSGVTNALDCTAGIVTCKRTATYSFIGAQCNNATAGLGWDTFSTNAPTPLCITGTNIQKGALGLPSAYTHIQQNSGTNSATTTVTTTYPAALAGGNGDMLVLSVAFNGTTTVTGCTDGTNAYTQAKHVANGALSLDVWVFHNATTKAAGTTLTCTFAGAASSALKWHEYIATNSTSTDVSASNTATGTSVGCSSTPSTAQATELSFGAVGALGGSSIINSTGTSSVDHGSIINGSTVGTDDEGLIAQTIGPQGCNFSLGASEVWAAAIVTFKAANASSAIAQRMVLLPTFFNAAQLVTSNIKWTVPVAPAGGFVTLGAALVCTADAATDDPVFNTGSQGAVTVPTSASNVISNTAFTLVSTGCAAGNTLHYQIKRLRYDSSDGYEGFVQVLGSNLQIGILQ